MVPAMRAAAQCLPRRGGPKAELEETPNRQGEMKDTSQRMRYPSIRHVGLAHRSHAVRTPSHAAYLTRPTRSPFSPAEDGRPTTKGLTLLRQMWNRGPFSLGTYVQQLYALLDRELVEVNASYMLPLVLLTPCRPFREQHAFIGQNLVQAFPALPGEQHTSPGQAFANPPAWLLAGSIEMFSRGVLQDMVTQNGGGGILSLYPMAIAVICRKESAIFKPPFSPFKISMHLAELRC
ncbi:hypothetical protein GE09DRAFT_215033 [Coniochaeta sp. 2T2.1]|nr:hypothetical protein GE09DRAFT_215033 [Coniochaeta sp. 2T2.1]